MKITTILIALLILLTPRLYGQNGSCALTSDSLIPLRLQYDINLEKGEYVISLRKEQWESNLHHHNLIYEESIDSFFALNKSNGLLTPTYSVGDIDSLDIMTQANLEQVVSLSIHVSNYNKEKKLILFKDLPLISKLLLPNLKSLHLLLSNVANEVELDIGLSEWSNYSNLKRNNYLESFHFKDRRNEYSLTHPIDKSILSDLSPFTQLKSLEIPMYLNEELLNFPNLESIFFFNTEYFFAHNFANLNIEYYIWQYHDWRNSFQNTAQRMYFLNQSNHAIDTVQIIKNLDYTDPNIRRRYNVDKFDSIVKLANGSGQFTVLRHDYFSSESYHAQLKNDTLWNGRLKNGKMVGKWKIFDSQSKSYFMIDFDRLGSQDVPNDGYFKYYFPNGQLGIEGDMKDGKKEGVWKFYELNGELASIKTFKNGSPRGLFIDYSLRYANHMSVSEVRRYYVNDYEYYFGVIKDSCLIPKLQFIKKLKDEVYSFDPADGSLIQLDYDVGVVARYSIEDKNYCKIVYKEFLKKLYPESRKKDIPFINCHCR